MPNYSGDTGYHPNAESDYIDSSNQYFGTNPVSSGSQVAKYEGTDPAEYYQWLIENDPENATAWREKYGSMLESNSSVSRYMKQLQDAGINPLYILGSGGISTNAVSSGNSVANYESNRRANRVNADRVGAMVGTGLGVAAIGAIIKLIALLL